MQKLKFITLIVLLAFTVPTFTGCAVFGSIKGAPIEAGHDPIVVHAERLQNSSLDVFKHVTKWEYDNRNVLPVEVSRAIDKYRVEFPPAWKESRKILADYKANRGTGTNDIERLNAVLRTVETSLLRLRQNHNPNQITQAVNALSNLITTIQTLRGKQVTPKAVVQ